MAKSMLGRQKQQMDKNLNRIGLTHSQTQPLITSQHHFIALQYLTRDMSCLFVQCSSCGMYVNFQRTGSELCDLRTVNQNEMLSIFCIVVQRPTVYINQFNSLNFVTSRSSRKVFLYPTDALQSAVFIVVRCPSVCLSVCHTPILV